MQKARKREKSNAYRNVFKTIVYSHIKKLLKQEKYEKDMKIELDKRDDKNINIKNKNDSNKNDGENDFRHLENNTFLESDESKYGSENYIDDETNDEEDSDDKN